MFVDLGRLRAFKGSQKYKAPDGVDLTYFPNVVIWCEQFSVLISPADLTFEQAANHAALCVPAMPDGQDGRQGN